MQTQTAKKATVNITRVFDAPVSLVWKAWTEPDHYKKWWGPKTYSAPYAEMDVRPGGKVVSSMRGPDGKDIYSVGIYKEVQPLKKLVVTDSFADEHGNPVSPQSYGFSPEFPMELQVTVSFEDIGGKTKMTLRHEGFPAGKEADQAKEGWSESFDKLDDHLKSLST